MFQKTARKQQTERKQIVSINCHVNLFFFQPATRGHVINKTINYLQGFPASVTYSPPKMGTTEGAHFLNITKLRREDKSKLTAATYKHYRYDTKKERQQKKKKKKHDLSSIKASFLPQPPPKKKKKTTIPLR